MEQIPKVNVRINYKKCKPDKCSETGRCKSALSCPKKVLKQENHNEYPHINPSAFCKGCVKCIEECPLGAVEKLDVD